MRWLPANRAPRYERHYLWAPILLLISVAVVVEWQGVDLAVARMVFAAEGGNWALKDHWLTETLIHEGGRRFSAFLLLTVWALTAASALSSRWRAVRAPLLYLSLVLPLAPIVVAVLKSSVPVSCPWSLALFGGTDPWMDGWWGALTDPGSAAGGGCFPAGHASGGYTFVALYFALRDRLPRLRFAGLVFGLLLGITYDVAQQLRGAHFLSHGLWTLAISWLSAVVGYSVWQWLTAQRTITCDVAKT
ncbi:MAG: PAP2 family protein [Proteobacteria bacterium]|nr:MAG: PAP2 family protein [Pseudomonadota bacterium]QKK10856.1 MAG: phosphatase PAP2 family protein [Pseudomonadota bacterium]